MILGDISREEFLADYWQKKPLLIRSAIADFEPPIDGDELAGLALEQDVESRLIIGEDWKLEHGPFAEERFSSLPDSHWTLLVQAVDLWVPEVAELLKHFDFLPPWRIDDIMVSYAEDGGSVGPHFDYYDVFLIQGSGRRRWQIGEACNADTPLLKNTELKILEQFSPMAEWVLEPGDMLYLPPKIAHHGVAIGDCTTFSVGFRAPAATEMLDDLATELMTGIVAPNHLVDPPLTPAMAVEDIPDAYIQRVKKLLLKTLDDDALLAQWFAQFMTVPKYPMLLDQTGERRRASLKNKDGTTTRFENGLQD